jgi:hypothetical protein
MKILRHSNNETPKEKNPKGQIKIRYRNKKSKMTLNGDFPTRRGNIKLKISALPKDWSKLYWLGREERMNIFEEFFFHPDVHAKISNQRLPRGCHKDSSNFSKQIKRLAFYTNCVVKDLMENYPESKFMKKLI